MVFYCRRVGEKVKSFPTACEGSTAALEVGPPLRFTREAPTSGCVGCHAGVGAAEDFPIKTGKPRAHELIHGREETRLTGPVQRKEPKPHPKEFECMVVSEAPARMSRTEEVHRITENVYKVRRTLRWLGHLLHLAVEQRDRWRTEVCPTVVLQQ